MWAILRERNNCTFNEVQVSVIELKLLLGSCTLGTCNCRFYRLSLIYNVRALYTSCVHEVSPPQQLKLIIYSMVK
jgi:hypothetical protein